MCEARFYLVGDDDIINLNKVEYVYRSKSGRTDRAYVGVQFTDENSYVNFYGAIGVDLWNFLIKEYQLKGD